MSGWIGVDLDCTLAHYGKWTDGSIGEPIPSMVLRVLQWLDRGKDVRIFTARVAGSGIGDDTADFAADQRLRIDAWCLKYVGRKLPVTATKDLKMIELWDDRCVQVVPNTGIPVREEMRMNKDMVICLKEAVVRRQQDIDRLGGNLAEAKQQVMDLREIEAVLRLNIDSLEKENVELRKACDVRRKGKKS